MLFDRKWRDIRRTRRIFKNFNLPPTGKVIDISCGGGRLLKKIENSNNKLELIGADITPGYLALHPELSNIKFITAESNSLPFEDHSFDVSICSLTGHHYKDLTSVLKEMKRITKPGGQIYFTDIFPQNTISQKIYNYIKCGEPYHFEKFYIIQDIAKLLAEFNLKIENIGKVSYLPRVKTLIIKTPL